MVRGEQGTRVPGWRKRRRSRDGWLKIRGFAQNCQGRSWCSNGWTLPALRSHAAFLECLWSKPEPWRPFWSQCFCHGMAAAARACWVAWKPAKAFCKWPWKLLIWCCWHYCGCLKTFVWLNKQVSNPLRKNLHSALRNLTWGTNWSNLPLRSFTLKVKSQFDCVETLPAVEGLMTNRGFINSNSSVFTFSRVHLMIVSDNYLEISTVSCGLRKTEACDRRSWGGAVKGPDLWHRTLRCGMPETTEEQKLRGFSRGKVFSDLGRKVSLQTKYKEVQFRGNKPGIYSTEIGINLKRHRVTVSHSDLTTYLYIIPWRRFKYMKCFNWFKMFTF